MGSLLRLLALAGTTTLMIALNATARTWYITPDGSGDAPTIQAGVDSAAVGDTVLVAAGEYYENLVMASGIILQSESGAETTILDGSAAGSVIDCASVSAATVIAGFTITGGEAPYGGGICCWDGSSPRIENNILAGNTARHGGGIACRYDSSPAILFNRICHNNAEDEGGGIYAVDGGATTILIEGNWIGENTVSAPVTGAGGGVWVGGIKCELRGNRIHGNSATNGGGGIWAGFPGMKSIVDNVIWANDCSNLGGGVWISQGSTVLEGNTFYANSALNGGAVSLGLGTMILSRNILAGSLEGSAIFVNNPSVVATLECSDLIGNAGGDEIPSPLMDIGGNFAAHPRFCDPASDDFSLAADSPCLPGNHPAGWDCGLMGALGQGCGPIALAPRTWARVKAKYR